MRVCLCERVEVFFLFFLFDVITNKPGLLVVKVF